MSQNTGLVAKAFELARSGSYANHAEIEADLRSGGYLAGGSRMTVAMRRAIDSTIILSHDLMAARSRQSVLT